MKTDIARESREEKWSEKVARQHEKKLSENRKKNIIRIETESERESKE